MARSIDFSRATASTICKSSSLLALTAMSYLLSDRCRSSRLGSARLRASLVLLALVFRLAGLPPSRGRTSCFGVLISAFSRRSASRISASVITSRASAISATASRATVSSAPRRRPPAADRRRVAPSTASTASMMPAKPLAAFERVAQLDARLVADGAAEIGFAHQRPVDARRRHFQPVGRADRVFEVEMRRDRHAGGLAILDAHRAVRLLGHHLQDRRGGGGELHPHQPIADARSGRRDDLGDAPRLPVLDDEPRLVETLGRGLERRDMGCHHAAGRANKKERVPAGAHSQNLSAFSREV